MVLSVESSNQAISAPSGWTIFTNANAFDGTAAAAGSVRLNVFWRRWLSGDTDPTVADTGDHTYAVITTYRGCITTGNPHNVDNSNSTSGSAGTAVTVFGQTTTVPETLCILVVAGGADAATARLSAETCATLTNITERFDLGTTNGTGGGIAIVDGGFAGVGATANFTATIVSQKWAAWAGFIAGVYVPHVNPYIQLLPQ